MYAISAEVIVLEPLIRLSLAVVLLLFRETQILVHKPPRRLPKVRESCSSLNSELCYHFVEVR